LKRLARGGFTLLEVLMAIAILGLGLTVLLGAQSGLFANAKRAERLSFATQLARCRMSELELELLQKGYPLIDQESEGACCMDEDEEGFRCSWKIQRIELPESSGLEGDADGGVSSTDSMGTESTGALGALMDIQEKGAGALGEGADITSLAENLGSASAGADGLVSMVMGFVYPSLKPMLEASIRKVVVTVHWKEGVRDRSLVVTQFVTDPRQGELDPNAADGLEDGGLMGGLGGLGVGTGTGTSGKDGGR
jgi:general secretion pathway protein I